MDRCDTYLRRWARFVRWLAEAAPSEREFPESFFLWTYAPRSPSQEVPDRWNALMDSVWREVEAAA